MVLFYHVIQSDKPPPMDGFDLSEELKVIAVAQRGLAGGDRRKLKR
jgi:hypothetical protein